MPDPKKGVAYMFDLGLEDAANPGTFKVNPALAAGDVLVTRDGVLLGNIATLPTLLPAASDNVRVVLNTTEMNGDRVTVDFKDVAGNEWKPVKVTIQPTVQTIDDVQAASVEIRGPGYLGDFKPNALIDIPFNSLKGGVLTTLAGSPVIAIYKDNNLTQSVAGGTLAVDYDGLAGHNNYHLDASVDATVFSSGSNFVAVVQVGTVGGTTAAGRFVAAFSIRNRAALMPTNAEATLDVTAAGNAAIDWGNIENVTATVNFTNTTVRNVTDVLAAVVALAAAFTTYTSGYLAAIWANASRTLTDFSATFHTEYLDTEVEPGATVRQSHRLTNSAAGGKVAGAGTTTPTIRDLADTKNRVTATTDANGNRTAVTRDLT